MKRTIKTSDAVSVYPVLSVIKYPKTNKKAVFAIMRDAERLRPISERYSNFVRESREKLKPDNFEQQAAKAARFERLTPEEQAEVNRAGLEYERSVNECVRPMYEEEHEIDLDPLSDDDIFDIIAANDLDVETVSRLRVLLSFTEDAPGA